MEEYYDESDIIHYNTDSIVCPHCAFYYYDCTDFVADEGTEACVNCGCDFKYRRNIFVTFDTEKLS